MLRRVVFLPSAVVFCLLLMSLPGVAHAEWFENGNAVCEEPSGQFDPVLIETTDGGAILAWTDGRNGSTDIYAQRIDACGRSLWTAGGVPLCLADSVQIGPRIAGDSNGGAIVTWYDKRNGNYDVYAQRIDATGFTLWTTNGVPVVVTSGDQIGAHIASDENGGAYIAWWDQRGGSYYDLYAQRLNASGAPQWTANGIGISTNPYDQLLAAMIPDGSGGAIVAWSDYRNEISVPDVYIQRVNASGTSLWTAGGVAVCVQSGTQFTSSLFSNGAGGAVVTWGDYRGADNDIYIQLVDGDGVPQWTTNGVLVCGASGTQKEPVSVPCPEGVIIAWLDNRTTSWEIYAQRIDMGGITQWTAGGEPVSLGAWDRIHLRMTSDMMGGAIVTWTGSNFETRDIFVQQINPEGVSSWSAEDIILCTESYEQLKSEIIPDGVGGAIVTWMDERTGAYDVYAQRITRQGHWGVPAARITSVPDVPGDQGGQVWIKFNASRLDTWQSQGIDYYSIWRTISTAAGLTLGGRVIELAGPAQAHKDLVGNAYFASPEEAWQLIGTVDAHYLSEYGFLAETARDSTSFDTAVEQYFISAHSTSGVDWWDGCPAEGYSVDNLAPCLPGPVLAEFTGGTNLWIHWNPNCEIDLHHYSVYRGASADFVPDETNRLSTDTDTSFVDGGYGYGSEYYYKVSAWDVHENESPFALITPDMITGVPGGEPPRANALFQNAPNPFDASTHIAFALEKAGHVRLTIFDAKGRLVRTLIDVERSPNQYTERWDGRDADGRAVASGMYFYRIETPGWKDVKKMTLTR
jgi:hypothetical protein